MRPTAAPARPSRRRTSSFTRSPAAGARRRRGACAGTALVAFTAAGGRLPFAVAACWRSPLDSDCELKPTERACVHAFGCVWGQHAGRLRRQVGAKGARRHHRRPRRRPRRPRPHPPPQQVATARTHHHSRSPRDTRTPLGSVAGRRAAHARTNKRAHTHTRAWVRAGCWC